MKKKEELLFFFKNYGKAQLRCPNCLICFPQSASFFHPPIHRFFSPQRYLHRGSSKENAAKIIFFAQLQKKMKYSTDVYRGSKVYLIFGLLYTTLQHEMNTNHCMNSYRLTLCLGGSVQQAITHTGTKTSMKARNTVKYAKTISHLVSLGLEATQDESRRNPGKFWFNICLNCVENTRKQ